MPSENKKTDAAGSKITGLDVFKNIAGALVLSFLVYWIPIITEQFYSPTEIRYHYTKLGELSGYLFSIQNFSRHQIDDLSIFIDAKIGPVYQHGAASLELTSSSRPSMVKLKNVAPHTDATLFVALEPALESAQVRVSSSSTITVFEDTQFVRRDFWSPSTFLASIFTALLYLSFGLYVAGQRRQMASEATVLRESLKKLDENADRLKEEMEKKLEDLNWRMMRARVQMLRHITRLNEEVAVWRRFFRSLYSSAFSSKNDAAPAMDLILKLSGVHMTKRVRDYSESEFMTILEEADRNRFKSKKESKLSDVSRRAD